MTTKTPEALAVLDDMAATVQLVSDQHKAWHARILAARAALAAVYVIGREVEQADADGELTDALVNKLREALAAVEVLK